MLHTFREITDLSHSPGLCFISNILSILGWSDKELWPVRHSDRLLSLRFSTLKARIFQRSPESKLKMPRLRK